MTKAPNPAWRHRPHTLNLPRGWSVSILLAGAQRILALCHEATDPAYVDGRIEVLIVRSVPLEPAWWATHDWNRREGRKWWVERWESYAA